MVAQRKDDIALILRQNNEIGTITIIDVDENFAALCETNREALLNTPFLDILGAKTVEYLTDAIEYGADGVDLSEACQKLRELRVKNSSGADIIRAFRVERIDSPDGYEWFRLILAGDDQRVIRDMLNQSLQEHFAGQASTSPETGLLTGEAAEAYLGMLKNVLPSRDMDGCCALLRIDRFDKSLARYGKAGSLQLLNHVANCCKSTFRSEDIVCQINNHTLAMFLVDINHDAARVVLNRLRWNIRNHRIAFGGKEDFSVTVSISFGSVLTPGESILERCKRTVEALTVDDRNQLLELNA